MRRWWQATDGIRALTALVLVAVALLVVLTVIGEA
jgi:hypothetical protein